MTGSTTSLLHAQADALRSVAESPLARAFLGAVPTLTTPEGRDTATYYDCFGDDAPRPSLRGRTPLAYVRLLDRLARHGLTTLDGLRLLDFGYGSVGALRLFAACGADAVGVDADLEMAALYDRDEDQGPFPPGSPRGAVTLVHGRFPGDPAIAARVGAGFDLVIAKNVLKRGMVHPSEPVEASRRVDLGVSDAAFLGAIASVLVSGGLFAIYNLSPRAEPDAPYLPHADGRCAFTAAQLGEAGFEVIEHDASDVGGASAMARALGWSVLFEIAPERDIVSSCTIARRH